MGRVRGDVRRGVRVSVLGSGEVLGEVCVLRRSVERGGGKCVGVWGR